MSLRGAFFATTLAPYVICLENHAGEQSRVLCRPGLQPDSFCDLGLDYQFTLRSFAVIARSALAFRDKAIPLLEVRLLQRQKLPLRNDGRKVS